MKGCWCGCRFGVVEQRSRHCEVSSFDDAHREARLALGKPTLTSLVSEEPLVGFDHYGSRRLTGADAGASRRSQARRPLALRVHRLENERVAFVTSGRVIQHRETADACRLPILTGRFAAILPRKPHRVARRIGCDAEALLPGACRGVGDLHNGLPISPPLVPPLVQCAARSAAHCALRLPRPQTEVAIGYFCCRKVSDHDLFSVAHPRARHAKTAASARM